MYSRQLYRIAALPERDKLEYYKWQIQCLAKISDTTMELQLSHLDCFVYFSILACR